MKRGRESGPILILPTNAPYFPTERSKSKDNYPEDLVKTATFLINELLTVPLGDFKSLNYEVRSYSDTLRRTITIHGKIVGKDDVLFIASETDLQTGNPKTGYIERKSTKDNVEDESARQLQDVIELSRWVGQLSRKRSIKVR